ncbi:MAG: lipoprotein [Rubrivivax sp.]|nr:lipoprotein [Rubrivivax sp.]
MNRNGNRWGSVSVARVFAAAMVLGALAACGQKGPLTLPGTAAAPAASAPAATGPATGASR